MERRLYGVRFGEEDWQECLLTEKEDRFEDAKAWAIKNGFDPKRFRVAEFNWERPNFSKVVR
jgi:hypothetical protein